MRRRLIVTAGLAAVFVIFTPFVSQFFGDKTWTVGYALLVLAFCSALATVAWLLSAHIAKQTQEMRESDQSNSVVSAFSWVINRWRDEFVNMQVGTPLRNVCRVLALLIGLGTIGVVLGWWLSGHWPAPLEAFKFVFGGVAGCAVFGYVAVAASKGESRRGAPKAHWGK